MFYKIWILDKLTGRSVVAPQWPHSSLNPNKLFNITHKLTPFSIFPHSSLPPTLQLWPQQASQKITPATAQAPSTAVEKLRRFNFLHFIIATQTSLKLLPSRPAPRRPSRQNLLLHCPKIFAAQKSQDDFPSSKSGYSSNLGLMGCMELKTRQLQWKKKEILCFVGELQKGEGRGELG